MGRVQVYVPSVHVSLLTNWRESEKDIDFTTLGNNIESPLNPIL